MAKLLAQFIITLDLYKIINLFSNNFKSRGLMSIVDTRMPNLKILSLSIHLQNSLQSNWQFVRPKI